ncbi:MAG: c-type cytochrome, partial [Burkholderiales bacterium]|nr:c-type cytochrome [Burkholderiales bacterium]
AAAGGTAARADDVDAGRVRAQACVACHGPLGLSSQPEVPHLAGQPADYLKAQLRAFRSGARKNEVMSLMARDLGDADIDQLAAWFSAVRVQAQPPR